MGMFSKQVTFKNRTIRKEIAEQLSKCWWSISDFGKFLKLRGVELPVHTVEYDRFRKVAKLRSESNKWYELKFADSQEAIQSTREDQISKYLMEFYQNTKDTYFEFWLTKGNETNRYQVGYSPSTYEVGKSIRLENSTVKMTYGRSFNRYQLLTENGTPRILIEITNPLEAIRGGYINIQNTRKIEKYLEEFECIGGHNSAEGILEEISELVGFDIKRSENLRIMCQPMGDVPKTEINITKIVKWHSEVMEFAAQEGDSTYAWKNNGDYQYEDIQRSILYDSKKDEYVATAKWRESTPPICDAFIITIIDKISNLKKRLGA